MIKVFILCFCLFSLVACSSMQSKTSQNTQSTRNCGHSISDEESMQLDLAITLMDEDKLHAALAHLDNIDTRSLRADYLRAETLRQLGNTTQAKSLYSKLLDTCMAGSGQHGLGLIAAEQDDLPAALSHLKLATTALPIDPRVRNDYGYALLLNGQFSQARHEFLTALELGDKANHAKNNLILLLLVTDKQQKAKQLAQKFAINSAVLLSLREHSNSLKRTIKQHQQIDQ